MLHKGVPYRYIGAAPSLSSFQTAYVGRSFTKHWREWVFHQATGSYIRGNNGRSKGLIPMLRNFNETARYVEQGGGKRSFGAAQRFQFFWGRCSASFQLILVRKLLVITPRSSSESSFTVLRDGIYCRHL